MENGHYYITLYLFLKIFREIYFAYEKTPRPEKDLAPVGSGRRKRRILTAFASVVLTK